MLKDNLVLANGGSSELWVNMIANIDVTADHVKGNTMGAGLGLFSMAVELCAVVVVASMVMIVTVVMAVAIMTSLMRIIDNDIVVRVSVVRNKHASIRITGKLNRIRVDLLDRDNERLAIGLQYSCGGGHSSCCEFSISS